MVIAFKCKCGKKLGAKELHAGRCVKCPDCGQVLEVPTPSAPKSAEPKQELGDAFHAPVRQVPPQPTPEPPTIPPPPLVPEVVEKQKHVIQAEIRSPFLAGTQVQPQTNIQVNVPQSKSSHSLGIASIVLACFGTLTFCVPFVSIPLLSLGLALGIGGIVLAVARQGTGIGFSIAGTAICGLVLLPMIMFWYVVSETARTFDEVSGDSYRTNQIAVETDETPTVADVLGHTSTNENAAQKDAQEWYCAEWGGGYSSSRELDRDYSSGDYNLTLKLIVRTEPEIQIKELYGNLVFIKDKKIIYESKVAETPDVSFIDRCFVFLKIDPYDDNNPSHRTLRYAKDNELTPVFTISKVVLANGTEKTFD